MQIIILCKPSGIYNLSEYDRSKFKKKIILMLNGSCLAAHIVYPCGVQISTHHRCKLANVKIR